METNVDRPTHPSDTFAFEARSLLGRMHDRVRGTAFVEELPRAADGDAQPRPVVVEAATTAARTVGIVVTLIIVCALAIAGALFGFAGAMSLITG